MTGADAGMIASAPDATSGFNVKLLLVDVGPMPEAVKILSRTLVFLLHYAGSK
jgi:hypothetical protein